MAGDDVLILPDDVTIVRVRELGQKTRALLRLQDDVCAIIRKGHAYPTKVIDPESAELLEEFRRPATMVEAVMSYSRARQQNPEQVLNKALTLLQHLRYTNVLVCAGSPAAEKPPTIKDLDVVSEFTVLEHVHHGMANVYRVVDGRETCFALKLWSRKGGNPFLHEAAVLERLDGIVTPSMREIGMWQGRQYLVEDWCGGICLAEVLGVDAMAGSSHRNIAVFDRIDLAYRILRAYMEIHRRGIIHGEVHPQNIFVEQGGAVRIIDFYHSIYPVTDQAAPEGDCDFSYYEPGYAIESLSSGANLPLTFRDEQYAIASLLFHVLSGVRYSHGTIDPACPDPSEPVMQCGAIFSPANIARLLARALSPDPAKRYPSLEEFAAEVMGAVHPRLGGRI